MRNPLKILIVIGTRPEVIKMAPLVSVLRDEPGIEAKVCITGQHRQLLDPMLDIFRIHPDYDLDIMQHEQTLLGVTSAILTKLDFVLQESQPDIVLVQGDTSTTLAAALAAHYRKIEVGHVEAGLRTGNRFAPWPEEANRKLTSVLTSYHFVPTENARDNLLRECVPYDDIYVTGNTVIDTLLEAVSKIRSDENFRHRLEAQFRFLDPAKRIILVTCHRRENFGSRFEAICFALAEIAQRGDVQIVYPVHLNPNVQEPARCILAKIPNVFLLEPQTYFPFVYLMDRATLIITDSGGIQEEAPALGKPVLVTRDITERSEGVSTGTARLVGANTATIISEANRLLDDPIAYAAMAQACNPYGDGGAALRIRDILVGVCSTPSR